VSHVDLFQYWKNLALASADVAQLVWGWVTELALEKARAAHAGVHAIGLLAPAPKWGFY
jgi:hypothetical protein